MASVGGSLTWEAEDLEGELCLGAGVGAAGQDKKSQMLTDTNILLGIEADAKGPRSYVSWLMVL